MTASTEASAAPHSGLDGVLESTSPLRNQLLAHQVYRAVTTPPRLRVFMEHHVFAVWDFMSLLKWLQRELTCVSVPWLPAGNAFARRLINEIVVEEESDEDGATYASHFEMYLRAMKQSGASTKAIDDFIRRLRREEPIESALSACGAAPSVQRFVRTTWATFTPGAPHRAAAAFTIGREGLIPDMFREILDDVKDRFPGQVDDFCSYLSRHISLDEGHHGPLAEQMLCSLCGDDETKWREAAESAAECLAARIALWDGVLAEINR